MIASIESTSAGLASDFDIGRWALSVGRFLNQFKHPHCGIMSGNAANSPTSQGAFSTEKHIFVFSLNTPRANLGSTLGKWKRRRVMKNVPMIHPQRVLD